MALYTLLNNVSSNTTGSALDCRNGKTSVVLVSGNFNADVKFQASLDGTNWFPYVGCVNGSISSGEVRAPSYIEFDVEGIAYLRPIVANFVTGNITVTGYVEARRVGDYSFVHYNAATTGTLIKTGSSVLFSVNVGDPGSAMEIDLYDGTSTSGQLIAKLKPTVSGSYQFNAALNNGLYVVISGTTVGDVTITYA